MYNCCCSLTDLLFYSFGTVPKNRRECCFYIITLIPFFSIYSYYHLYKESFSPKVTGTIFLRGALSVIGFGLLVLILDIIFDVAKLICNCCCKPKVKDINEIEMKNMACNEDEVQESEEVEVKTIVR